MTQKVIPPTPGSLLWYISLNSILSSFCLHKYLISCYVAKNLSIVWIALPSKYPPVTTMMPNTLQSLQWQRCLISTSHCSDKDAQYSQVTAVIKMSNENAFNNFLWLKFTILWIYTFYIILADIRRFLPCP